MSSSSNTADGRLHSRNSTPATDVSPPDSPDFVLPPPSEESLRRRAQSDRASAEIGNRMLKGWAMLAEECPNDDCWAIPLVRYPRARPGADLDPRKECVICGTTYVSDENGQLVAQPHLSSRSQLTAPRSPNEPLVTAGRAMPKKPNTSVATLNQHTQSTSAGSSRIDRTSVPHSQQNTIAASPFEPAEDALKGALDTLSQRLIQVSLASDLNLKQVKETAEAMGTVMWMLDMARRLKAGS